MPEAGMLLLSISRAFQYDLVFGNNYAHKSNSETPDEKFMVQEKIKYLPGKFFCNWRCASNALSCKGTG